MNHRHVLAAIGLSLALMVLLFWPMILSTTWPIALRCDPVTLRALYMTSATCGAAATDSSCVCLPLAQSIGYESLPVCIQAAEIALVAVLWSLYASSARRLLRLNLALGVAVLANAAFGARTGGWALLALIYAPLAALAAVLLSTLTYFVSSRLLAPRQRATLEQR